VKHVGKHDTPSPAGYKVIKVINNWEKLDDSAQKKYRGGVGSLLHLVKYSRPDLGNCIHELSKVMDMANDGHEKELWKVIKYVLDTSRLKLNFDPQKNDCGIFYLTGKLNSDYAGNKEDIRSIMGWLVFFMGLLIAWRSKSQAHITLSSTEAESVAVTDLCCESLFCKKILEFIGVKIEYSFLVEVDNQGAVFLAKNEYTSSWTKHIDRKYLFV